jgi:fibronectin type 3 domain-containing protein
MDGEGLTKPLEVEIFREIRAPGTARSQAPSANSNSAISVPTIGIPWVTLEASDLARLARGQKVVYVDRPSEPQFVSSLESAFSYRVRALTRGFRGRAILSETSNRADAALLDVSGAVQNLKVDPTEKALSLTWEAPARTLSGAPVAHLAGYRVYRSEKPKLESFRAVGECKEPAFFDPHFEFGGTYRYKVRAVFKQGTQEAESEDSRPCELTPRDIFPPQMPQGLTALYTVGAVELIWNANREPDLAGYNVYRREDGKPSQQINKDLVRTPIYRDSAIEVQRHYFYQVTAVDLSGNESKPSTEAQADTQ